MITAILLKFVVLFQCLSQHDLVGAQDISHLKKTVFTVLTRLREDRAYTNAYEVCSLTYSEEIINYRKGLNAFSVTGEID